MFFESRNGSKYRIVTNPSVFTNRNNASQQLRDIVLQRQAKPGEGGGRYEDSLRYITAAIWAQEDLSIIREHEALPPEIDLVTFYKWGLTSVQPFKLQVIQDLARALYDRAATWQPEARLLGNISAARLVALSNWVLHPDGEQVPAPIHDTAVELQRYAANHCASVLLCESCADERTGWNVEMQGIEAKDLVILARVLVAMPTTDMVMSEAL